MVFADYFVLLFYGAGIVGIGVSLGRLVKNSKDLFAAGGQSPWWVSGLSSFMTMFSAGTFVVWGGIAFRLGFVAVSISACYGIAAVIVGWTIAGKWKKLGVSSAAEFIELRYGRSLVQFYTWIQGLFTVFSLGGAIYALSLVVCTLVELPVGLESGFFEFLRDDASGTLSVLWFSVAIVAAVIAVTLSGGLWAVLITDTLQFVVLSVSVVFVVPLILGEAGGLGGFIEAAGETVVDDAGNTLLSPVAGNYTWWFLFGWVLIHYAKIGGEWAFVQRFACVPEPRDARKSAYLFGVMYLVSPLFWMLPAIAFRTIMPVPEAMTGDLASYLNPGDYAHLEISQRLALDAGNWEAVPEEELRKLKDPAVKRLSERAYILACQFVLPPGMIGLMVAAMISATASMATTQLNVYAGAFTEQIFGRFVSPANEAIGLVRLGRLMTFILGLVALAGAILIPRVGTFEEYIVAFSASLTFPLVLPTIWGLVSGRIGLKAAWISTAVGVLSSLTVKIGFQGQSALFADFSWAEPLVRIASSNVSVVDWVVGLVVPATLLLGFHLSANGPCKTNQLPTRKVVDTSQGEPIKASTLPAKLVGWSLLVLGLLFVMLLPSAGTRMPVLGLFSLVLVLGGVAILYLLKFSEGKANR